MHKTIWIIMLSYEDKLLFPSAPPFLDLVIIHIIFCLILTTILSWMSSVVFIRVFIFVAYYLLKFPISQLGIIRCFIGLGHPPLGTLSIRNLLICNSGCDTHGCTWIVSNTRAGAVCEVGWCWLHDVESHYTEEEEIMGEVGVEVQMNEAVSTNLEHA